MKHLDRGGILNPKSGQSNPAFVYNKERLTDMEAKKDAESIRRERVRQLWKARSPEDRAYETGPLNFCKWLEDHNLSELLPPGQGDSCQRLRTELLEDGLLATEETQKETEKKTEKETKK